MDFTTDVTEFFLHKSELDDDISKDPYKFSTDAVSSVLFLTVPMFWH